MLPKCPVHFRNLLQIGHGILHLSDFALEFGHATQPFQCTIKVAAPQAKLCESLPVGNVVWRKASAVFQCLDCFVKILSAFVVGCKLIELRQCLFEFALAEVHVGKLGVDGPVVGQKLLRLLQRLLRASQIVRSGVRFGHAPHQFALCKRR